MVPKNPFDSILEKDFFFNMQKDGNIRYWNGQEYKKNGLYYRGAFAYYFQYMMKKGGGNDNDEDEGKNDEFSMITTLLPKYYGLFAFQVFMEKSYEKNFITKI